LAASHAEVVVAAEREVGHAYHVQPHRWQLLDPKERMSFGYVMVRSLEGGR
jgi:hypothetical protein